MVKMLNIFRRVISKFTNSILFQIFRRFKTFFGKFSSIPVNIRLDQLSMSSIHRRDDNEIDERIIESRKEHKKAAAHG